MEFKVMTAPELSQSVFDWIKKGMPLLTAEHEGAVNAMTVNWGQMGYLWNKCVSTIYVRPQRFTFPLVDGAEGYSLSFLDPRRYAEEIMYCGRQSGRDGDKLTHCGLTVGHRNGVPYVEQAGTVLICRKLYGAWLARDGFLDQAIVDSAYPEGDFHKMYVGEIQEVLVKE